MQSEPEVLITEQGKRNIQCLHPALQMSRHQRSLFLHSFTTNSEGKPPRLEQCKYNLCPKLIFLFEKPSDRVYLLKGPRGHFPAWPFVHLVRSLVSPESSCNGSSPFHA